MLVLLLSFSILLIIGLPLFFVLGISSALYLIVDGTNLMIVAQKLVSGTDSFPLLAAPFFILAGDLMLKGGLSDRLIAVFNTILGHVRGGLSSVTVMSAMFFAAISGSAPATTASIGSIMIPEMEKRGYTKSFATALATAAGPMGQIIPPSIPMIIYAVIADVSIGDLFLAGVIPGILIGVSLMIVGYIHSRRHHIAVNVNRGTIKEFLVKLWDAKWSLLAPVIVLGGIYGGIFTPTEASAIAVVYGLIVGLFVHKGISLRDLPKIFIKSSHTSIIVVSVISAASIFGWIMSTSGIAVNLSQKFLSVSDNPIILLLMINVLLLVVGALMDNIAAMVVLVPVLTPIADFLNMDPVHFGAMVVINFAIGMATPPIGYSLFVGASISNLKIEVISKALIPLLIAMIIVLFMVAYIPSLTLWLPSLVK